MTIAPISRTVFVNASPEKAFRRFTEHMIDWWPAFATISKTPRSQIVLEPHVEGRWFERDDEGTETQWGRVLAWDPPARLLLTWQIDATWSFDPTFETELELTFVAKDGGTEVTLEHRNLERYGESAAKQREMLDGGWPTIITNFAENMRMNEG